MKKHTFDSVVIDLENRTMEILNGSEGIYHLDDMERCAVLNEKASHKGKEKPFSAVLPKAGLPSPILRGSQLYVGIKVIMKDGQILAIYVSKEPTQVGTDQYQKDKETADKIYACLVQR